MIAVCGYHGNHGDGYTQEELYLSLVCVRQDIDYCKIGDEQIIIKYRQII